MKINQISRVMNESMLPNFLGVDSDENPITIKEDLSNVLDFGVQMEKADADTFKGFLGKLIVGVHKLWIDTNPYTLSTPNIFVDDMEYGALVNRIRFNNLEYRDGENTTLQDGKDYNPYVYKNPNFVSKVFSQETTYSPDTPSISRNTLKTVFSSAENVGEFVNGIMVQIDNSLKLASHMLVMRTLLGLAAGAKRINLVTEYNTLTGKSLNSETALSDYEFLKFACEVIINVKRMIKNPSKKYNDGSVVTFSSDNNTHLTLLSLFDTALSVNMRSNTYHNSFTEFGKYDMVDYWQTQGQSIIPKLSECGHIDLKSDEWKTETNTDGSVEIENVIGMIYDDNACGVSIRPLTVDVAYSERGRFFNYFYTQNRRNFVDTCGNCVLLTLN